LIASAVQRYSLGRKKMAIDSAKITPEKNIVALMQQQHATQLIYGHIHSTSLTEFVIDSKSARRIVLGAWDETGNYLTIDSDNLANIVNF
jgi:UDP-2,3-diacylglucosamine pyrophosphatase LpxH